MLTQPTTKLKVLQNNVQHWPTIINSHGLSNHQALNIPGYFCNQRCRTGEQHAGVPIAVRTGMQHTIHDDFHYSDTLYIKLMSPLGAFNIATTYIPPREGCIMFPDFNKLLHIPEPMYILDDLNARHTSLGKSNTNTTGRNIMKIITTFEAQQIGPNFPTFIDHSVLTAPGVILTNGKTYHNTHFSQGPLMSCDHLPILFTISTTPIVVPYPQRMDTKRANWKQYKNITDSELPDLNLEGNNTDGIETVFNKWYGAVKTAQAQQYPSRGTKHYHTPPKPRDY